MYTFHNVIFHSPQLASGANIQGVLGVRCTPTELQCHRYYIFEFILVKDSSNYLPASRDS
jgi:hypothetical protein